MTRLDHTNWHRMLVQQYLCGSSWVHQGREDELLGRDHLHQSTHRLDVRPTMRSDRLWINGGKLNEQRANAPIPTIE